METRNVPKVLLVDDDRLFLFGVRRILRAERFDVLLATGAAEALTLLRENDVSVVVSDLRMPGCDGLSFLTQVRQHYPHIPRIVLSGNLSLQSARMAVNRGGATRLLEKPVREMDLVTAMRGAVAESEHRQASARTMELLQMQSSYIGHLESESPGVTKVERDELGRIVIDDDDIEDQ